MSKKYLYIIIGILIVAVLCLLTYKTSEEIVFNDKKEMISQDFGIVDKTKTPLYNHTFKYFNSKYDSLEIYGVKDGCDCTESNVKTGVYRKNDTILVNTKYDPNKYNDNGIIVKQIFLISNKKISKFDSILPLILKGKIQ
ncbi:hypothetical protein ASG22_17325 [Chryseobacterium sp. Leaf405]|uniref:DUF1573 domain-containing protein n=1 Tax=Chryseobacterium sp. Leaf405 TaxID=1736367 RepID=UPI00070124D9|nr:DUF1573 domain-containing protein [Chryseobacterium sp. Leaf405]KQT33862.1 hypothetical protein ASG22_17325 [Chryseobacterium sp. Leaf405]